MEGERVMDDTRTSRWRLITSDSDEWPTDALDELAPVVGGKPRALWASGPASLGELTRRAATVTGPRNGDASAMERGAHLAVALAERGVTLVTGAGYGFEATAV